MCENIGLRPRDTIKLIQGHLVPNKVLIQSNQLLVIRRQHYLLNASILLKLRPVLMYILRMT